MSTIFNTAFVVDCSPNPCVHGSCTNSPSGYSCGCQTGYKGTKCEQGTELNEKPFLRNVQTLNLMTM